eukprot:evm.model.NODE_5168_length_23940_cov_50.421009.2
MGSKGARRSLPKASDDEAERQEVEVSGAFARMVVPVLAAFDGKFASTSVKRRLVVLKNKIDELVIAMKDEGKQKTETN